MLDAASLATLGFTRIERVLSPERAAAWLDEVLRRMREDPARYVVECRAGAHVDAVRALDLARPSTWPCARLTYHAEGSRPLEDVSLRLAAAVRAAVGGADRVLREEVGEHVVLNLDPGGALGDGSSLHWDEPRADATLARLRLGLIVLLPLTDAPEGSGGTRVAIGSHRVTARRLARAAAEGVDLGDPRVRDEVLAASGEVVELTAAAGDALLIHPLALHGPGVARAPTARALVTANVFLRDGYRHERSSATRSPVERALDGALPDALDEAPRAPDAGSVLLDRLGGGRALDALALAGALAASPASPARELAAMFARALVGEPEAAFASARACVERGAFGPVLIEALGSAVDRPDLAGTHPAALVDEEAIRAATEPVRMRADLTLKTIVHQPPEAVLAALDALAEAEPGSPHPRCYRGELRLWLGAYEAARADFEEAAEVARTRWASIGLAAALTFLGEREAARAAFADCEGFPPLAAATLHPYLGHAHRVAGALGPARVELERSVAARP
ncbi:MAG: phytanoyl-CoA dioxygenase family protein, partial [Sandaracinaceae bacterium]|nr:phytanoyl-CoA dioxygenase family protein [Sandaracinaceae bacterium]